MWYKAQYTSTHSTHVTSGNIKQCVSNKQHQNYVICDMNTTKNTPSPSVRSLKWAFISAHSLKLQAFIPSCILPITTVKCVLYTCLNVILRHCILLSGIYTVLCTYNCIDNKRINYCTTRHTYIIYNISNAYWTVMQDNRKQESCQHRTHPFPDGPDLHSRSLGLNSIQLMDSPSKW